MHTMHSQESDHVLMIYPHFVKVGRKRLFFILLCSFIFVILGGGIILTNSGENMLIGWLVVLFFGLCFLVSLVQLSWGPLFLVNEEGVQIRSNPFEKRIMLFWQEITTITLFDQKYIGYLGFALSPAFLQEFLQRQTSWNRKRIEKRLNRSYLVVRLPQSLSPYSLRSLLALIHDKYHTQIERHHISIELKNR